MDMQILLNMTFAAAGTLMGIMLNRLWTTVDHLADTDMKLAEKVQNIEVLVAGRYITRPELEGMENRLVTRLDMIWNEVKNKADKPINGNGGVK